MKNLYVTTAARSTTDMKPTVSNEMKIEKNDKQKHELSGLTLVTPRQIEMARLITLKTILRLEMKTGLQHSSGYNAYARIKREFGFRGNKERVYTQFCEYVEKMKGVL